VAIAAVVDQNLCLGKVALSRCQTILGVMRSVSAPTAVLLDQIGNFRSLIQKQASFSLISRRHLRDFQKLRDAIHPLDDTVPAFLHRTLNLLHLIGNFLLRLVDQPLVEFGSRRAVAAAAFANRPIGRSGTTAAPLQINKTVIFFVAAVHPSLFRILVTMEA